MQAITHKFDIGNGTEVSIETGRLAKQSDGAIVLKIGNTMMLGVVVSDKDADPGIDFLPLMVDYKEKYAANGKFPGGFFKREARPSEHEILICRLVDRALRPLFPDDYHSNTIISLQLISSDNDTNPDSLACLAASAAIAVSDIPFNGPVSEVRVGRINGEFVVNPMISQMGESDIDMIIAGTEEDVVMVEGEMKEISEKEMADAIAFAHKHIQAHCKALKALSSQVEAAKAKREYDHETNDADLEKRIHESCYQKCYDIAAQGLADKHKRSELFSEVIDTFKETLSEEELEEKAGLIGKYFGKTKKQAVRDCMLKTKKRLDGRTTTEVRPIWTEIDYLLGAHGPSIFTRGETQSLTTVTLGTKLDEQIIDGAVLEGRNKFFLHYNFPAFSTGEARMPRSTSRREVGHGNLAERSLKLMLPEDNVYTIRVVSDILESNGSSSMATVCAGSMALMDAGIQMKNAVSGIAMGLIMNENKEYIVLSDILGDEDHLGDMDFKVAGTKNGITACQMDIKINGLPYDVLIEALEQAKAGRHHILDEMAKTIDKPRTELKPHAPRIVSMEIDKEFIGAVIGPGGKIIQEIQAETETTITIDEVDNKGVIEIFGNNGESMDKAIARIKSIVAVPEVGEEYDAIVKSIMPYGAFVEFIPGKQGLLHISEISWSRIETMEGVFTEGDTVRVKLIEIDKQGRFRLSRKVLMPKPEKESTEE
jgi:polyribonucleotide nucleotidyltransferase